MVNVPKVFSLVTELTSNAAVSELSTSVTVKWPFVLSWLLVTDSSSVTAPTSVSPASKLITDRSSLPSITIEITCSVPSIEVTVIASDKVSPASNACITSNSLSRT